MTENKRIGYLDIARVIAILLVILTHACERAGFPCIEYKSIMYSITRIGVPIFLMLSGGLMIPKAAQLNVSDFYKKYWSRIIQFLLLLFFYAAATNFTHMYWTQDLSLSETLREFHKSNGITSSKTGAGIQLWYMHVIIGFYLFLLFFKFINTLTTKSLLVFIALCSLPLIHVSFFSKTAGAIVTPYIAYFATGYLIINRLTFKKKKRVIFFSAAIIVSCIIYALNVDLSKNSFQGWVHWYTSSPTIYFSSIALFIIIRVLCHHIRSCTIITALSKHSFGIYLSHYLFLWGITKIFPKPLTTDTGDILQNTILYFFFSLILSWIYTAIVIRIPYLRKLVA